MKKGIVRLARLGLLLLAVLCLREAQQRRQAEMDADALTAGRVRDFFPEAQEVATLVGGGGWLEVRDAEGRRLGTVAQTAPESDRPSREAHRSRQLRRITRLQADLLTRVPKCSW